MKPKEILDDITNKDLYDGKMEKDTFMYHAEGGYPHILEDLTIKAMESYAKQESEKYITALTAIANQTDEQISLTDAGARSRGLARRVLNLD